MAPRLQLHDILLSFAENVYFQPPENVKLVYPCILYRRDYEQSEFGDNVPYRRTKRYMIIVVDRNPDSDIPDKVASMPMCTYNRFYTADNLNHDVYNVFF